MNRSVFSSRMFRTGIKNIKIPAFIFLALTVLVSFIYPLAGDIISMVTRNANANYARAVVDASAIMLPMFYIPLICLAILILTAFSPINKRGSSDFYQALPYTRECMYFSWLLACVAVCAAITAIGGILSLIEKVMFPGLYIVSLNGFFDVVLSFIAVSCFAAGCTLIAMSVTGKFFSNAAGTLILMYLPRTILFLVRLMIINNFTILNNAHTLRFLRPEMNVFFYAPVSAIESGAGGLFGTVSPVFWQNNIGHDIYTLLVGAVYIAVGALLFKIRKSEIAGQSAENRVIQGCLRVAVGFTISIFGTLILVLMSGSEYEMIIFAVVLYVIAAIAFFAFEIISTRKWKNLLKAIPSFLIVIALNVLVVLVVFGGKAVALIMSPDAENVESIRMVDSNFYYYGNSDDYFNDIRSNVEIKAPAAIEAATKALKDEQEKIVRNGENFYMYREQMTLAIKTKKYGTIYRTIALNTDQIDAIETGLLGEEEFVKMLMMLPEPVKGSLSIAINTEYDRVELFTSGYERSENDYAYDDSFGITPMSEEEAELVYETLQAEVKEVGADRWYQSLTHGLNTGNLTIRYNVNASGFRRINIRVEASVFPKTYDVMLKIITGHQSLKNVKTVFDGNAERYTYEYYVTVVKPGPEGSPEKMFITSYMLDDESNEAVRKVIRKQLGSSEIPSSRGYMVISGYLWNDNDNDTYYGKDYPLFAIIPLPEDAEIETLWGISEIPGGIIY